MKKVLAVSGGVDSMVMLDFLLKNTPKNEIIVAHFDHGTRPSSKDDYEFVRDYCARLGIEFVGEHAKLGINVSEAVAREKRYDFLNKVAQEIDGKIYTAHHLDDLVESVTINFLRGTGWRGLAVLNNQNIERPLLSWAKNDILKYAAENQIIFRQDPTNIEDNYLRNRIRPLVKQLSLATKQEIFALRKQQIRIEQTIAEILTAILPSDNEFERAWFKNLDDEVAMELLRTKIAATRPQLLDFLQAIRNYQPGKYFNLPNDKLVKISAKTFMI